MKKLVFSISLILSYTFIAIAGVVKSIPAKADEFTNGNIVTVTPSISETDLNTYNNALQVLEYLRQGGTIDFSNVSDNYTSGDLLEEFIDLIDTVGSGIDYYGNNFLDNIFDLSSDTVKLSPNTKLKDRIGQFRSNLPSYLNLNSENPTPTPSPNPNYIQYIDCINGNTAWGNSQAYIPMIYNFVANPDMSYSQFLGSIRGRTIYRNPNTGGGFVKPSGYTSYNYASGIVTGANIVTIRIYEDDQGYYITNFQKPLEKLFYYTYNNPRETAFGIIVYPEGYYTSTVGMNYDTYNYYEEQFNAHYNTLDDLFQFLVQTVRNVNIYVNDIPWSLVTQDTPSYNISLGTGTYLKETNQPIEYKFEIPVYVDISDLLDKIDLAIDNKINLDFPYLNDLIVDTNGQQTIAVTIFSEDYTIDDLYVKDYGAMIPLFPLWVEYPVALEHINTVATVGIVDVIPSDILEVLGIFLIVGLFVYLCHRLME